ncbi:phage tail protein [Pseudomarimonas salicorniae]|uniref:Tail fiber protein n=1 Tax=Pseudomarimonas salicorniae TaxID=2933270 RepID=A0ABT0GKB4_9GAMM|nr:tail fiber protein [Lysobacter sp. CAU 1642]MCK7594970.1 tail fiber protein [Lysobacter sp. CAU 1642]
MSEPYVGEIRMFAGNFAPAGWAFCDGQLLSISQNDALFSLLGTIYGGDGETTFGLPDLRGRLPIHAGSGPGLTPRTLGQGAGTESETLIANQLPPHTHVLQASSGLANSPGPQGNVLATSTGLDLFIDEAPSVSLHATGMDATGGSQSHSNLMPYLCVHFIIALVGIYPSSS